MPKFNIPTIVVTPPPKQKKKKRSKKKQPSPIESHVLVSGVSKAPVAQQRTVRQGAPRFTNGKESVTVSHREYIADISRTSNVFDSTIVRINPGVANSFPWLSQVAGRFESYTFSRLDYIFEPMVATTQSGSVMMAIDFDAADTSAPDKTTLMSYKGAVRSAPWQACRLVSSAIDREKMVKERFVRTGAVPAGTDVKTYDMGNLQLSTVGTGAATVVLGELYVEYTVTLRTPQIATSPGLTLQRKTTQSGVIQIRGGNIVANIANVVGEGSQAMVLANIGTREFLVHPSVRNFILATASTPLSTSGNWTSAFSTIFQTPLINAISAYNQAGADTPILNRASNPINGFQKVGSTMSSKNTMRETVQVFTIDPADNGQNRGSRTTGVATSGYPFQIRSGLVNGTADYDVEYTLTPIAADVSPAMDVTWPAGANVADSTLKFQWPTDVNPMPARMQGNEITYGRLPNVVPPPEKLK